MKKSILAIICLALLAGCAAMKSANTVDRKELAEESTVVVVRPDRYTLLLGTRSMRDYLEVVYEEFSVNAAGYPVVKIGVRNKGGEHWWDLRGPDFTLYAQAVFYRDPVIGTDVRSAPLYRTNKQPIPMERGETADISFTSPVKGAKGYQVVLSED